MGLVKDFIVLYWAAGGHTAVYTSKRCLHRTKYNYVDESASAGFWVWRWYLLKSNKTFGEAPHAQYSTGRVEVFVCFSVAPEKSKGFRSSLPLKHQRLHLCCLSYGHTADSASEESRLRSENSQRPEALCLNGGAVPACGRISAREPTCKQAAERREAALLWAGFLFGKCMQTLRNMIYKIIPCVNACVNLVDL